MRRATLLLWVGLSVAAAPHPAAGEDETFDIRTRMELGFLDALSHKIQFGSDGTYIDYVGEGGQDVLFGFARASVELRLRERHTVVFLYQPLQFATETVAARDLVIDDVTFPSGTPLDMRYSFPFYRASYTWDFSPDPETEISFGGSLQLRNATIVFTSVDGSLRRFERDVGPVPILRFRYRRPVTRGSWFEGEIDGFYAPIKYINGDKTDVIGAIADASVRYGFDVSDRVDAFLNLRYLGGGSEGTGDESEFGDGFTRNWLHFFTVTIGFTVSP